MHITILLTLSIPAGKANLPVRVRWDAHLHSEPAVSDQILFSKGLVGGDISACVVHFVQTTINSPFPHEVVWIFKMCYKQMYELLMTYDTQYNNREIEYMDHNYSSDDSS